MRLRCSDLIIASSSPGFSYEDEIQKKGDLESEFIIAKKVPQASYLINHLEML